MALHKPWYKVVTPREDLREGRPLDASEFAVHLDQVRDGRAPVDYRDPQRFFERTYFAKGLADFAAEVLRRLSGERTETSAVFNLATQFGGGKTHALTLLYHLARAGPEAARFPGVRSILERAGLNSVPTAATAVFVGTEFDSITGRGGQDGSPRRKTPWGEIAWQLGGAEAFAAIEEHERDFIEPKGDVIRSFLPKDRPCIILMDEIINYASTYRSRGYHNRLYNFIQALSETVRGAHGAVLVVSIPASEIEYTSEDETDEQRFRKMLDRLGKAVILAAESETSEIIRRRLFEWGGLPEDARRTIAECADWMVEHRQQIPNWFPIDNAREAFAASYPFHPMVLSVFERKWRGLPRFQQTRGILRLLALWVSRAYQEGFQGAHRDALIGLGTAPLDDTRFRAAVFEQLGEARLEGAVTTDICGKKDSHAVRLDKEAVDSIKKARLHRKVATAIFFESNGGQLRAEATVPEIRLAVGEPELDLGNVETALEALTDACYFLTVDRNHYRFSFKENLNKRFADRRASIDPGKINELVREEIRKVFTAGPVIERCWLPEKSSQVSHLPALTLVILAPEHSMADEARTLELVETMTREHGTSSRTFKSALIWCVPDNASALQEEARKVLAWDAIREEQDDLRLDDEQRRQVGESLKKAQRDLKECVWRTYRHVLLLGKNNQMRQVDLGLVHSSAAANLASLIVDRLRKEGDIDDGISPTFLVKHWPSLTEWSTKAVRDAAFASPVFPRLLDAEVIKDTIVRGVGNGLLAYVGKTAGGDYDPFFFRTSLTRADVEFSDDMFVISKETAEACLKSRVAPPALTPTAPSVLESAVSPPAVGEFRLTPPPAPAMPMRMTWSGEVSSQKWMNFYTKVLARFATGPGLRLSVQLEVSQQEGISTQRIEETKVALRELGLKDDLEIV